MTDLRSIGAAVDIDGILSQYGLPGTATENPHEDRSNHPRLLSKIASNAKTGTAASAPVVLATQPDANTAFSQSGRISASGPGDFDAADRLPEVARDQRLGDVNKQIDDNNAALKPLMKRRDALDSEASLLQGTGATGMNERYAAINDRLAPLEAKKQQLRRSEGSSGTSLHKRALNAKRPHA